MSSLRKMCSLSGHLSSATSAKPKSSTEICLICEYICSFITRFRNEQHGFCVEKFIHQLKRLLRITQANVKKKIANQC